jgi:acyl-CoA synthetase (AMP-forming)/AMP-acid ligase II
VTIMTVPELLEELAWQEPRKIAVITPTASATYADLLAGSTRCAGQLITMGARKGTLVALLAPNDLDWIMWWAGCARIGAVVVPMNTFAAPAEVQHTLAHSGAHILVAVPTFGDTAYRDELAPVLGGANPRCDRRASVLPQLRRVLWLDEVERVIAAPDSQSVVEALSVDVEAADPLTIIYSSGSTGTPKGVVHSHGATLRQAQRLATLTGVDATTVLWTSMPLNWVGGLVWSLLRVMVCGGTFLTQPWFEPAAALAMFTACGVDTVTAWGPVVDRLRQHPDFDPSRHGDITGLGHTLPMAGDRPSALGMSETLGPHSGWAGHPGEDPPPAARGSWGRALDGMAHRVVDPATGAEVAEGASGELQVRGDSLMVGLHRRERSAVFTPDGWYRTGDAAHLHEGWLFFDGRLDDVIKTAGANVSPAEVVAVLEALPGVLMAFVVGVPSSQRGHEVAAVVVADPSVAPPRTDDLIGGCRRRLASYKVPRRVLIITEDQVPWLSSQKVDRARLRAMILAG